MLSSLELAQEAQLRLSRYSAARFVKNNKRTRHAGLF